MPTATNHGGVFALRAHCALLLDYVLPEEPPSTPLGNALRIMWPKLQVAIDFIMKTGISLASRIVPSTSCAHFDMQWGWLGIWGN